MTYTAGGREPYRIAEAFPRRPRGPHELSADEIDAAREAYRRHIQSMVTHQCLGCAEEWPCATYRCRGCDWLAWRWRRRRVS
ncbi:MAG: hypothetical protein ACRDTM_06040 [Micromonosporaceae bacterium]